MTEKIDRLFSSKNGRAVYEKICSTIDKEGMAPLIKRGVLIGLSGGADSVFLLSFFYRYRKENPDVNLLSLHVNHLIRGGEAVRDMEFSSMLSRSLGIEHLSQKIDVPALSRERKCGLEETAREERYKIFGDIISSRNDISAVAVAHNSTDNTETIIFNMLRGSGMRGMCGIPPVRDNIIRPLIRISKSDIEGLLNEFDIPFVVDSTNRQTEYTRNYIRHEILPKFRYISPCPEEALLRLSDIMRENAAYFDLQAERIFDTVYNGDGYILHADLLNLAPAMQSEIVRKMLEKHYVKYEYNHIKKVCELLSGGAFSYDVPSGYCFVSNGERCYLSKEKPQNLSEYGFSFPLKMGINEFEDFNGAIILSETKLTDSYSNVYKIAIQRSFAFDIINKGLYVRSKKDGDSYRYSNMSHKLKKMFNDSDIPPSLRPLVPIICDNDGILWPVGFSPRDGVSPRNGEKHLYIALATSISPNANKNFYFKQNNTSKKKGS